MLSKNIKIIRNNKITKISKLIIDASHLMPNISRLLTI